jgi:hypothetical protein
MTRHVVRGYPFRPNRWYELSARRRADGVTEGLVNGEVLVEWNMSRDRWDGKAGLFAEKLVSVYQDLLLGLPAREHEGPFVQDGAAYLPAGSNAEGRVLVVRADDGHARTQQTVKVDE